MQIDLNKLISDLLPTWLRSSKMVRMILVLVSQAIKAFNRFNINIPDWLYQINADASVISLQHQIKRELDVDAVITELSGQPIDFLVTVNGFVDENRLRALIESRKLAGKSFVFQTGDMVYECEWSNYVCVQSYIDNFIHGGKLIGGADYDVVIIADLQPESDLSIVAYVYEVDNNNPYLFNLTISADSWVEDSDYANKFTWLFIAQIEIGPGAFRPLNVDTVVISSILPAKDNKYKYLPNNS